MRVQTYRDQSLPSHFDLIYGGAPARSIDLVLVTTATILVVGFAGALIRRAHDRSFDAVGSLNSC